MTDITETHAHGGAHRITTIEDIGLRVVTERVPGVRSVALGAWIGTGSRHEDDQSRGYAHFLEHLLFKGNDCIDAEGISRYFDGIGSDVNAATTREYTAVSARVLDRHVEGSLDIIGEMLFAPGLDSDDVDAEREVILEEIAMYDDSPSDVVHEAADALVFADHALGRPIVGTVDSIADAPVDRLRRFHEGNYAPANLVVSAAGAVDHDAFVEIVRRKLVADRIAPDVVDERAAATFAAPLAHVPAVDLREKETEQVHLVLAGRGISRRDERRHAAALLDSIVGNAPSSRLFLEIREKRGLAYSVYSFVSSHADSGEAGLYVGVRPDRVATVLDVIREQLDKLVAEPPTEEELESAKGQLEGRMLLSLESTTVRGNRLGASLVSGMPIESLETTVGKLRAVTTAEVHALASELFAPQGLSLAAVAEDVDAVRIAAANAGLLPGASRAGVRA